LQDFKARLFERDAKGGGGNWAVPLGGRATRFCGARTVTNTRPEGIGVFFPKTPHRGNGFPMEPKPGAVGDLPPPRVRPGLMAARGGQAFFGSPQKNTVLGGRAGPDLGLFWGNGGRSGGLGKRAKRQRRCFPASPHGGGAPQGKPPPPPPSKKKKKKTFVAARDFSSLWWVPKNKTRVAAFLSTAPKTTRSLVRVTSFIRGRQKTNRRFRGPPNTAGRAHSGPAPGASFPAGRANRWARGQRDYHPHAAWARAAVGSGHTMLMIIATAVPFFLYRPKGDLPNSRAD